MRVAKNATKETRREGKPRLFRFKLPSEEFFRTAVVAAAIAFGSVCLAGNAGISHETGIRQKECAASIGQIADYAGRHPLRSSIFLLADVAAIAAFSIFYYGAISSRSKMGMHSD